MKPRPGVARAKPWQAERPGAAAGRQAAGDELFAVVAFDVPSDKARKKLAGICKDYGLSRAQWSVFEGALSRNRREELFARIERLFAEAEGGGRAAIYAIGARELGFALRCATTGAAIAVGGTEGG